MTENGKGGAKHPALFLLAALTHAVAHHLLQTDQNHQYWPRYGHEIRTHHVQSPKQEHKTNEHDTKSDHLMTRTLGWAVHSFRHTPLRLG